MNVTAGLNFAWDAEREGAAVTKVVPFFNLIIHYDVGSFCQWSLGIIKYLNFPQAW